MSNRQIKATIIDIEPKLDKNHHPYYKISLSGVYLLITFMLLVIIFLKALDKS